MLASIMKHFEKEILDSEGWVELETNSSDEELLSIAKSIGAIAKHPNGQEIFELKPKNGLSSVKGTFSNRFGFKQFPLHTDTAFYARPIRYMMLHSIDESQCSTTILHSDSILNSLSKEEYDLARKAVFTIKTNSATFYSSLLFIHNNIKGFKYDPTCMFPANKAGKIIESRIRNALRTCNKVPLKWSGNNTLIIDNWKCLHGREASKEDYKRVLKRIYIN